MDCRPILHFICSDTSKVFVGNWLFKGLSTIVYTAGDEDEEISVLLLLLLKVPLVVAVVVTVVGIVVFVFVFVFVDGELVIVPVVFVDDIDEVEDKLEEDERRLIFIDPDVL